MHPAVPPRQRCALLTLDPGFPQRVLWCSFSRTRTSARRLPLAFPPLSECSDHKHTQRKPACFPLASLNQGLYVSLSKSLSRTLAWQVRVRKRREERERAREGEREKRGCWASWPARSLSLVYQYTASADLLLQAGRKELLYRKAEASRFKEVGAWISGLGS